MAIFLSDRELAQTEPAENLDFKFPVPTRILSNGEFNPLPQTQRQRRFEERLKDLSEASLTSPIRPAVARFSRGK
jgi:uncharacterized protein